MAIRHRNNIRRRTAAASAAAAHETNQNNCHWNEFLNKLHSASLRHGPYNVSILAGPLRHLLGGFAIDTDIKINSMHLSRAHLWAAVMPLLNDM